MNTPLLGAACVSDFGTPPDTTSLRERIAIALWTLLAVLLEPVLRGVE